MPKTIYDHQPWENKTTKGAEGEHMLESKAIKTVISAILTARTLISVPNLDSPQRQFHHVCFPTIYSITLLFLCPLRPCSVFPESNASSEWLMRETHLGKILATLLIHPGYTSICHPATRWNECKEKNNRAVPCRVFLRVCVCSLMSFTLGMCASIKIAVSTISLDCFTLLL